MHLLTVGAVGGEVSARRRMVYIGGISVAHSRALLVIFRVAAEEVSAC